MMRRDDMRKIYKPLKEEQRERGVIFSSTLSLKTIEVEGDVTHEVIRGQEREVETIIRLLDDSDFDSSPCYRYNIIRK
jgi:hypothetical protein